MAGPRKKSMLAMSSDFEDTGFEDDFDDDGLDDDPEDAQDS